MKLKEKIKNKIKAVKSECRRSQTLTYDEWLKDNGLNDDGENRALYGSYVIETDNNNKKADLRLSQIIGRGIFVVCLLVILVCMFVNSASASDVCYIDGNFDKNEIDSCYAYTDKTTFTWDNFDRSFDLTYYQLFNSGGYSYNMYYVRNIEYFYEIITANVDVINQSNIYNFLNDYASEYPSNVNGYLGSAWDSGAPLQYLYYEYDYERSLIFSDGYDVGFDSGTNVGFQNGYIEGHDEGYNLGYDVGLQDGFDDGHTEGFTLGYNEGYTVGLDEGELAKKSIFAIFDAPIKALTSLLDFELFGINFLSIFKVILTVLMLGAIAKFVLSIAL